KVVTSRHVRAVVLRTAVDRAAGRTERRARRILLGAARIIAVDDLGARGTLVADQRSAVGGRIGDRSLVVGMRHDCTAAYPADDGTGIVAVGGTARHGSQIETLVDHAAAAARYAARSAVAGGGSQRAVVSASAQLDVAV